MKIRVRAHCKFTRMIIAIASVRAILCKIDDRIDNAKRRRMNKKKKNKRETQNDITKGKERALAIVSDPDRPTNSMDNANR